MSARHLRRSTEARLGVSPVELAQSRRLALGKQLLQDTTLPVTAIAFAAGFGSVRRFNALFAERMGSAPSAIRRRGAGEHRDTLALRLDFRAPYDWSSILGFLRARAIPGVEVVTDDAYRRIVHLGATTGVIEVRRAERPALVLALSPELLPVLMPLVAHVRRLFDLDARPDVIADVLGRDPLLARLVAARPGLRVPGAIDPFEAAIRALLGQQVSVAAATTLAGRFVARFGTAHAGGEDLTHRFPTAAEIAVRTPAEIAAIGLPAARAAAIHAFATAIARGTVRLDGRELEPFVASVIALPGVGPWTAHYLAMRALHLSDAFPAADLGIRKALDAGPRDAEARAERWRPFRSYAVLHLWTSLGAKPHDDHDDDDHLAPRPDPAVRPRGRAGRAVPRHPARAGRAGAAQRRARARRDPARRILRG